VWGLNTYQPLRDEPPEGEMELEAEFFVSCLLNVHVKPVWMYVDEMLCWRWRKMGQLVVCTWVQGFVTIEGGHRRRNRDQNVAWLRLCQRCERLDSCDERKKRSACVSDDQVLGSAI
jgi:hypothetical protein